MLNSYIKYKLTELNRVKVLLFSNTPLTSDAKYTLFKENEKGVPLKIVKSASMPSVSIVELELPENYEFGKEYSIHYSNSTREPIDLCDVPTFPEFDKLFNYDGNDLGATYSKNETKFALWAPLASRVLLNIKKPDGEFVRYDMTRTDKGVYRITLQGDYLNAYYSYIVTNSGVTVESIDPYGKGSSANTEYSGVVDIEAIKNIKSVKPNTQIENYVDSIIYEVGIRDLTEQNGGATDIVNRGKYLGFIEEGRKTKGGHPAGLDYLVKLGVTHIQLNPVIDFGSVDDLDTSKKYNWGYDPITMFNLEGSYSLHPEIPMERLKEFKMLVNKLHEKDMRVILDVVYNHIYEHVSSCFEKIVPNYYFRRRHDGLIANASGCGDDVATEKYMVRKMIVESMQYFVEVFDVDGYRFDLMGLIDIHTLKSGYKRIKEIKEDVMVYGEGWNMGIELPYEEKGCSDNADKLPMYGFFNDSIRDIVKGPTFHSDIKKKGYVNGDINYAYGLKYAIYGSTLDVNYSPRYKDANQSINYIECHDNNTLFDKLNYSNEDETEDIILKRVKLGNAILTTLIGVPFFHMGQEIGLSKNGNDNTYNVLNINKMDWNLIDERYDMVHYFRDLITFRKETPLFHLHKRSDLENLYTFLDNENGLFIYKCNKKSLLNGAEELMIVYNPLNKSITYDLGDDYNVIFHSSGFSPNKDITLRTLMMPPVNMVVLVRFKK